MNNVIRGEYNMQMYKTTPDQSIDELTLYLDNNSLIFVPPSVAHYQWSYYSLNRFPLYQTDAIRSENRASVRVKG